MDELGQTSTMASTREASSPSISTMAGSRAASSSSGDYVSFGGDPHRRRGVCLLSHTLRRRMAPSTNIPEPSELAQPSGTDPGKRSFGLDCVEGANQDREHVVRVLR